MNVAVYIVSEWAQKICERVNPSTCFGLPAATAFPAHEIETTPVAIDLPGFPHVRMNLFRTKRPLSDETGPFAKAPYGLGAQGRFDDRRRLGFAHLGAAPI